MLNVVGWHQVPNAVERLLLAETTGTGAGQLKEEAIRFITANTAAVSKTFANATFARLMWREDPSMCIGKMLEDFLDSSDLALFGRLHQGGGSLLWKVKNP